MDCPDGIGPGASRRVEPPGQIADSRSLLMTTDSGIYGSGSESTL